MHFNSVIVPTSDRWTKKLRLPNDDETAMDTNENLGRCRSELDISNIHEIAEPDNVDPISYKKRNIFTLTCEHALKVKGDMRPPETSLHNFIDGLAILFRNRNAGT
jgi:hypothetical protein